MFGPVAAIITEGLDMSPFLWSLVALGSLLVSAPPASASGPAKKPEVTLQVLDWDQTEKLIAGHRGKVVVVDIWTTTCQTCLEGFPELVRLHERYGKDGLVCVSVACDYDGIADKPPEFYRPQVLRFLRQQGATFENVLLSVPFVTFLEKIDLGSTPAVLIYNREGKRVRRFDNDEAESEADEFSPEDVRQLVEKLLKEKAPPAE